ncbi:hypothetical protein ACJ73_06798 [Blastomyces percursus]|uniref:Intradiol ring-cleavage dioxygenases domain-containing protein n=1 Tax=Blastomyces percursus TaxID=1658174 RepID=A0A1J9QNS5_9EURO|nr:hypothetical protein ACJ73_06798 [Blastomyces percursus]
MQLLSLALVPALLDVGSFAHPGHSIERDVHRRMHHLEHPARRGVHECTNDLQKRGWISHQADRRHARLNELRERAGHKSLARRDPSLDIELFAHQAGCVLDPEVMEGPYWVAGELIRQDVRSGVGGKVEPGVALHLDINVIDVSNCQPILDAYVELWGCNSTGVYTGVVARGNGDGNPAEIHNNALRGIQPTAHNGTASFTTLFPGHYTGRANHLHSRPDLFFPQESQIESYTFIQADQLTSTLVIIHHGATRLQNDTIRGGAISHVGQIYFNEPLLKTVEATSPYMTNKQRWTPNDRDMLFRVGFQGGDNPIVQTQTIGSSIEDGIWGTIDVGVNPRAVRNPKNVNWWTEDGGMPNDGSPWDEFPGSGGANPPKEAEPPNPPNPPEPSETGNGPARALRRGGAIGGAMRSVRSFFAYA